MAFESVRAYVQLASGLSDLTRARAMEAAQGLLSLPATGIATGTKMASRAATLTEELLAAAAANRSDLTTLVRAEVDTAIMTRLGLVPVQKFEEVQAEAARLRAENARLRSESSQAAAPKSAAKKAAAPRGTKTAKAATRSSTSRSAVTTRSNPAGT
ncbi:MAG TPA: hypothetical protein VFE92_17645 [Dermatophilaceae bacterium]|nr:hypothetical protein [Dermatophilaceae bacterium]